MECRFPVVQCTDIEKLVEELVKLVLAACVRIAQDQGDTTVYQIGYDAITLS